MKPILLLPAACALDALAGDPEWFPHPVRLMGHAIARGETLLRRPNASSRYELFAGTLLTASLVAATYCASRLLLRTSRRIDPAFGSALTCLLAWNCLAARSLYDEAATVVNALEAGDLPHARIRLARIVGRDTAALDEPEICRAVIETIAESLADGVIAPLLYLALGGVPLALAYKAVNTLDSMIGHADSRYLYFGKAAARLDDAANFLPARLTAALLTCAAPAPRAALRTWLADGSKHKSPNAGRPEAAMAGALGVCLGGRNTYAGEVVDSPRLGAHFPAPTVPQARAALRRIAAVTLLGVAVCTALSAYRSRR